MFVKGFHKADGWERKRTPEKNEGKPSNPKGQKIEGVPAIGPILGRNRSERTRQTERRGGRRFVAKRGKKIPLPEG